MTVAAFLPTCPLLLASAEIGARALSHPPSVVPRLLLQLYTPIEVFNPENDFWVR